MGNRCFFLVVAFHLFSPWSNVKSSRPFCPALLILRASCPTANAGAVGCRPRFLLFLGGFSLRGGCSGAFLLPGPSTTFLVGVYLGAPGGGLIFVGGGDNFLCSRYLLLFRGGGGRGATNLFRATASDFGFLRSIVLSIIFGGALRACLWRVRVLGSLLIFIVARGIGGGVAFLYLLRDFGGWVASGSFI